jgi:alkylated DNA repair protein alkB family protein 7
MLRLLPGCRVPGVWFAAEVVTPAQEQSLLADASRHLSRQRYQDAHFDKVISAYRETILPTRKWSPESQQVLLSLYALLAGSCSACVARQPVQWMDPHVLDLELGTGAIERHVDSVKHGGDIVAGLSLLSERVMCLDSDTTPDLKLELLLPPRSMYVLSGPARYSFAHALRPGPARRVSIVLRDEPPPPAWLSSASP